MFRFVPNLTPYSALNKRIPFFVLVSAIALVSLFVIQVKWMQKSTSLVEEQFDQKVSMALCMAVDQISQTEETNEFKSKCTIAPDGKKSCCSEELSTLIQKDNVKCLVASSFNYYDIDMPYEMGVSEDKGSVQKKEKLPYSCSLTPVTDTESHQLAVNFPDKETYVFEEMGLMLGSSFLILLLITLLVIYGNYYLIKQKKISERNKEFFNHMAHEFKTPLTNIGLASNMLNKKFDSPLIDIIAKENQQLNEQVNRVLTMASLESGQYLIANDKIDITKTVKEVVDNLSILIADKKASIEVVDNSDGMVVIGDSFHLSNAIKNIVDNSLKYSEASPEIRITIDNLNDKVKIRIEDNGIGISEKNQKLLFEKFYRCTEGDTYSTKGFGLGLSYVKKIIELHKGSISVKSVLNQGTQFELSLPNTPHYA